MISVQGEQMLKQGANFDKASENSMMWHCDGNHKISIYLQWLLF
jgi:hypothetical protein